MITTSSNASNTSSWKGRSMVLGENAMGRGLLDRATLRTVLSGQKLDLALHTLGFAVTLVLYFLTGPNSWDITAFASYFLFFSHVTVLFLQIGRAWPPLYNGRIVAMAGLVYWFLLEAFTQAGEYSSEVDAETVMYGLLLVQGFTLFFLGGYYLFYTQRKGIGNLAIRAFPRPGPPWAFCAMIVVGGLLFLIPIYRYRSGGDLSNFVQSLVASRTAYQLEGYQGRGNLGDETSGIRALSYFGWAAAVLGAGFLAHIKRNYFFKVFVAGTVLMVMVILFFIGARQRLGLAVLPALGIGYYALLEYYVKTPRRMVQLKIMLTFGLFLMYSAFEIQNYGRGYGFDQIHGRFIPIVIITPSGHQMFSEVLHATDVYPDKLPYVAPGSAFFFVMINPIPRFLWPEKPISAVWRDYARYRAGSEVVSNKGATISISIIGQFYAEGGAFMVGMAALFFALWATIADELMTTHGRNHGARAVGALMVTLLLLNYRGLNAGLYYVIPATILLMLGARIMESIVRSLFMKSGSQNRLAE